MMGVLAAIGAAVVRSSIMEHSTHQVSSRLSLEQVIAGAVGELERLQYSRRSLGRYRVVWRHLIVFGHEIRLGDEYSQKLVKHFCTAYQMRNGEHLHPPHWPQRPIVFPL